MGVQYIYIYILCKKISYIQTKTKTYIIYVRIMLSFWFIRLSKEIRFFASINFTIRLRRFRLTRERKWAAIINMRLISACRFRNQLKSTDLQYTVYYNKCSFNFYVYYLLLY